MNREFLKNLDLSEDTINSIMSENGKDINKIKAEADNLKKKYEETEEKLKSYSDYDTLKEYKDKYDTLLKTYESDTAKLKKNAYITEELYKANAKNVNILKGSIKSDEITLNDKGEYEGLTEQINSLKESDAYLFKSDKDNIPSSKTVGLDNDTNKPNTQTEFEKKFYEKLNETPY